MEITARENTRLVLNLDWEALIPFLPWIESNQGCWLEILSRSTACKLEGIQGFRVRGRRGVYFDDE
jgi:hypothetical protein